MNRAELIELIGAEIGNAWHAQDWEENIADALLVAISKHCGYLMEGSSSRNGKPSDSSTHGTSFSSRTDYGITTTSSAS